MLTEQKIPLGQYIAAFVDWLTQHGANYFDAIASTLETMIHGVTFALTWFNPLALIGEHGFTTKNFPEAMKKMNFWLVFANSAIITISATILTIIISAMASFVIVRNQKWKACALLFAAMVASMVIPFQVLMVPLVSVYGGTLGVLNHRLTLILMHTGFSVSMATFMLLVSFSASKIRMTSMPFSTAFFTNSLTKSSG